MTKPASRRPWGRAIGPASGPPDGPAGRKKAPGLGIDHVAAPRNGGRCSACLSAPAALVVGDVRDGGQLGQLRRDRSAHVEQRNRGTEEQEQGHVLVVVLRAAASYPLLAARSGCGRQRHGGLACRGDGGELLLRGGQIGLDLRRQLAESAPFLGLLRPVEQSSADLLQPGSCSGCP